MSQPVSKYPRASLLGLPIELKQQIYKNVFHVPTDSERPCEVTNIHSRNAGCRCGEGLSVASRDLYQDTRSRFYNCASFAFRTPMICNTFIECIGRFCVEVGSLEISYHNNAYEASLLWNIFEPLKTSTELHELRLQIRNRGGEMTDLETPLYMEPRSAHGAAFAWDIDFRPIHHPLAHLRALQKLTIIGHPGNGEIEEALYKASKNVEQFALSSGRVPSSFGISAGGAHSYSIESIPA